MQVLATSTATHPMFLWEVPLMWTLAQAATVPQDYAMVYYALYMLSGLESHDDVVVVGAATPCGLAAASITVYSGHEVAAVVDSRREVDFVADIVGLGRIYKRSEDYQSTFDVSNGSRRRCIVVYTGKDPVVDFEDDAEFLATKRLRILLIGDVDVQGELKKSG
jgi:NADPH:quinone reductase-like Zn-dependent oxidoreductase